MEEDIENRVQPVLGESPPLRATTGAGVSTMAITQWHRRIGAAAGCAGLLATCAASAQDAQLPPPLVHLSALDDTIQQDIRYATGSNFTGRPLPGYEAGECILALDVARGLARVQRGLKQRGLALRVYDCYRPRRAAAAMVAWVRTDGDTAQTGYNHPRIARRQLVSSGYVAAHSEHSQGIAVDLTLVSTGERTEPRTSANAGDCTSPIPQRRHDGSLDMGTDFDCFDRLSHTRASGITTEQRAARDILVEAMTREGFESYPREWWHFRFAGTARGTSFDVPVRALTTAGGTPRR